MLLHVHQKFLHVSFCFGLQTVRFPGCIFLSGAIFSFLGRAAEGASDSLTLSISISLSLYVRACVCVCVCKRENPATD